MLHKTSLQRQYFDRMYDLDTDPWSFATSTYEAEKYATTVELLCGRKYGLAFEIGCSIGVLTEMLAPYCAEFLAVDTSAKALDQAKLRNRRFSHVRFAQLDIPAEFPQARFSLIVVSEVAYYWDDDDDRRARDAVFAALEPGGMLVLVHYLPVVTEYPRTGDAVHEAYLGDARFSHLRSLRRELYRADTFSRA